MTRQEIGRNIETYVARQRSIRHWLTQASNPQQSAELERTLRVVSIVLLCLTKKLSASIRTDVRSAPRATWRMSLDDINVQLVALKTELRQIEEAREDTFKVTDDPTSLLPRIEYLAIASTLESIAVETRAELTEVEARAQVLHGHS